MVDLFRGVEVRAVSECRWTRLIGASTSDTRMKAGLFVSRDA
jgi:hypothetical protein